MPEAMEVPPCQKFACAIQDCLQKNDYQESKCSKELEDLTKCCKELITKNGKSVCCPEKKYKPSQ